LVDQLIGQPNLRKLNEIPNKILNKIKSIKELFIACRANFMLIQWGILRY